MRPETGEMLPTLGTMSVQLTLLRHADRIRIGCATGGLGNLCMTDREHAWHGACRIPFMQMIQTAGSTSLQPVLACETYDVEGYAIDDMNQYAGFEKVNYIQTAAALSPEENELTVFVINADWQEAQQLTLDVRGFGEDWRLQEHSSLYTEELSARNTYEHPDALIPRPMKETVFEKGICTAMLPRLSWNVFRFSKGAR